MNEITHDTWIVRGDWQVNLALRLAAHGAAGCVFRIVSDPLCAIWIEGRGPPPTIEQLGTLQARAVEPATKEVAPDEVAFEGNA